MRLFTAIILICLAAFSVRAKVIDPKVLLGENPGAVEGSGIVLIVLALALVSRKKKEAVSVKRI